MGLSQALYAGVSGLMSHQTFLDAIGNNLANVNTIAFKRAVVNFSDLFSQTLSGGTAPLGEVGGINPVQLGLGVRVAEISQDFSQGGIQATTQPSDLALEGRGFFVLAQGDALRYTRDGTFHLGVDGTLQSAEGWRLQGTNSDPVTGVIPQPSFATLESVIVPIGSTGGAMATAGIELAGNLNAAGEVATTGTRIQSVRLLTRTNDGVLGALATAAGGAAYTDAFGLHVAEASRCRPGDMLYIDGAGITPGLYTVATVNSAGNVVTVVEPLAAGMSGLTVYQPSQASDDLRYTEISTGGISGSLGGVYDENLNLLLGNAPTSGSPTIEIAVTKGDRLISETFRYGDTGLPEPSSGKEYNGTTLGDLAAYLEDITGVNSAYDPDNDHPGIGHDETVGDGGDDGVRDLDLFNEARLVFGRGDISGLADAFNMSGIGSLADGSISGSRLVGSGGAGSFTGVAVGTEVYLSGGGVTAGYYRVLDVAVDGSYVTLGDPATLYEDSAGATGLSGVSYEIAPNRLYVNGNLGTLNNIGGVRFESGAADENVFEGGLIQAADGESVRTSALVYDSLGGSHPLEITMVLVNRTANEATWRWYAESGDDTTYSEEPGTAPPPALPVTVSGIRTDRVVGWGDVVFDDAGVFRRAEPAGDGSVRNIEIDLSDLATDPRLVITPDFSSVTQFVSQSGNLEIASQDGFPAGVMQTFSVGIDGIVRGIYSNGVIQDIAQVALADFANVNGLLKQGENTYIPGVNSGDPVVSAPLTSGMGSVRGSSLELSNVDLAEEFTDLIVAQRGFQANARIITTSDQMLSELMNMIK
ncbi:MAG: flagellar hook-basal body complex protein [Planctomycetes bacterium]|nr:flagellar hook-basal body complex protein [Planctomycetota bacterium]